MGKSVIGDNIKVFRNRAGLTQKQFANILGITDELVDQYERGEKTPRAPVLRSMAPIFHVSVQDFLSDVGKTDLEHMGRSGVDIKQSSSSDELNPQEEQLIADFRQLNELGQAEAIKRLKELTEIPKYTES